MVQRAWCTSLNNQRAKTKMGGKGRKQRASHKWLNNRRARQQQKRSEKNNMSRQRDLVQLNQQLESLTAQRTKLIADYEVTRTKYEKKTNGILKKAGVLLVVQTLQDELEFERKSSQTGVDAIAAKIQEVQKIGQYLVAREKIDPDTPHMVEGIDINLLGLDARSKVLAGDAETIAQLHKQAAEQVAAQEVADKATAEAKAARLAADQDTPAPVAGA